MALVRATWLPLLHVRPPTLRRTRQCLLTWRCLRLPLHTPLQSSCPWPAKRPIALISLAGGGCGQLGSNCAQERGMSQAGLRQAAGGQRQAGPCDQPAAPRRQCLCNSLVPTRFCLRCSGPPAASPCGPVGSPAATATCRSGGCAAAGAGLPWSCPVPAACRNWSMRHASDALQGAVPAAAADAWHAPPASLCSRPLLSFCHRAPPCPAPPR